MNIKEVRKMIERVENREKEIRKNLEGHSALEDMVFEIGIDSSISDEGIKELIENEDERLKRLKDIDSALDKAEEIEEEVKENMENFNEIREALETLEKENEKMKKITGKERFFDFGIHNGMSNSEIEKLIEEDDNSIKFLKHWYKRKKEESKKERFKKYGKIAAVGAAALISGILISRRD